MAKRIHSKRDLGKVGNKNAIGRKTSETTKALRRSRQNNLWNARKEAMLRALVVEGKRIVEICDEFRMSPETLRRYRAEKMWQEKENAMREELYTIHKGRLSSLVSPAIDALDETVRSKDEGIKLRAATEILDRTGFPKGLQIETDMKPIINLFLPAHLKTAHLKTVVDASIDAEYEVESATEDNE